MNYLKSYAILLLLLSNFMLPPPVLATAKADSEITVIGDTNFDKILNTVDIQCFLLAVKNADSGILPDCMEITYAQADLNCDGKLNVVDVQVEIIMTFKKSLAASMDTDNNGLPDCQEKKVTCELKWEKFPDTYQEYALFDVWGSSPDNIYAVGNYNQINANSPKQYYPLLLHFNGQEWQEIMIEGIDMKFVTYYAVWGSSANDVFVVGQTPLDPLGNTMRGLILHFDGKKWSKIEHDVKDTSSFKTVWGYDNKNVFIGGYSQGSLAKGTLLKYDGGEKLKTVTASLPTLVTDITGLSPEHIFVGLSDLSLYEFKNANWQKVVKNDWKFHSVGNVANQDLYAIVESTTDTSLMTLLKYDANQQDWVNTDYSPVKGFYLYDVAGNSVDNFYVVGKKLSLLYSNLFKVDTMFAMFDAGKWSFVELNDKLAGKGMMAIWVFDSGEAVAINLTGEIYFYKEQCS